MKNVTYFNLGVSLYTPANHNHLMSSLEMGIQNATSIVVCTEDAVSDVQLPDALANLKACLKKFDDSHHFIRLVRPRNPEIFRQILDMEGIEKIDGFVLPKVTPAILNEYKSILRERVFTYKDKKKMFYLMPTLETKEALTVSGLHELRLTMDSMKKDIACVRIGGNDLMNLLGIKRMQGYTIYETPVRNVIDMIILEFRTNGYEVSAPVFDYIEDVTTLIRELKQDLSYGFFAKTAIHPNQVETIMDQYSKYLSENAKNAEDLLAEERRAVYKASGQMMEVSCHSNWAKRTIMFNSGMSDWIERERESKKVA